MYRDGVINLIAKIEFLDGRDSIELPMKDAKEIAETLAEQEDQLKKIVRCKYCDKAEVLSDHVICCNSRNTECQSYPLDFFCADGERRAD